MLERVNRVGRVWGNPANRSHRTEIRLLIYENRPLIERIVSDCRPGKCAAIHVAFSRHGKGMRADPTILSTRDFLGFGKEVAEAWIESPPEDLISAGIPEGLIYKGRPAPRFFGKQLLGVVGTASNLLERLEADIDRAGNGVSSRTFEMRLGFLDHQVAEAAKRPCLGFSPLM
ncbi:TPA: hypothetical protein EYP38_03440 [Candidatus Micrarchaeota archaeon]|nr:hypothetical protein [Candidatus Micrarchaeota archaeon]